MESGDWEVGDEEAKVLVENLASLGKVKDHQHSLQQMRGKLERHFADYTEYSDLAVQCGAELSKLQDEKSSLQNRLNQIDANIIQITELKGELETTCTSCVRSAPTELYKRLEEQVNEERGALGMERLPEYGVISELSDHTKQILSSTPTRQNRQSMDSVCGSKTHPYSIPVNKAGPSYKKCTKCDHLVSRNATTCSNCHSSCSRPGHSTGKKCKSQHI